MAQLETRILAGKSGHEPHREPFFTGTTHAMRWRLRRRLPDSPIRFNSMCVDFVT